ncbi:hypothetical protein HDU93_006157 [Gonapodya sp. JEL0774]|nr:hypothetical protein HDU93_006157 [Gonapodya sp. JEL0774]
MTVWAALVAVLNRYTDLGLQLPQSFVTLLGVVLAKTPEREEIVSKVGKLALGYAYAVKHYLRAEYDPSEWPDLADVAEYLPLDPYPDFTEVYLKPDSKTLEHKTNYENPRRFQSVDYPEKYTGIPMEAPYGKLDARSPTLLFWT